MIDTSSRSPVALLAALTLGVALAYICGTTPEGPSESPPAIVLTQILDDIRDNYVDELTPEQLTNLAYRGFDRMLKELDRHSGYIPPARVQDFEEDTEGYFVGIGVVLAPPESDDHYPQIAAVIRGGPAAQAGIAQGDLIERVQEEDVRGVKIPQLRKKIAGDPDSVVTLHILRGDAASSREIPIQRRRVETSSVTSVRLYEKDGQPLAGYVRLDQFQLVSAQEIKVATHNLVNEGAPALILDLRDNTGGILHQATQLAELFLPRATVIVTTKGRHNADKPEQVRVENPGPFQDLPLIILIDGGSASALELVSAALHDQSRALLVGEESFGKWSVQNIIALGAGGWNGRLKLTTKGFHPPTSKIRRNEKGHTLGLLPDVEVSTDSGTLRTRRQEWHEERLSRVNAPLEVTRVPIPAYTASEPEEQGDRHVDAVLIRALAILSSAEVYDKLLAEARARVTSTASAGTAGSPGSDTLADGDAAATASEPPQNRRP